MMLIRLSIEMTDSEMKYSIIEKMDGTQPVSKAK